MNTLIQNILAFSALGLSVYFLYKKFFGRKPKPKKSCGTDGTDCGCH
ncbi:FeoB-associated Cys-rich membrane protein [Formosa sp. S-31]